MKTVVLKVRSEHPAIGKIRVAAQIIRKGGLVAFPTETVYGLGANALSRGAVEKIYAAKERPLDNPIIVHVAGPQELPEIVEEVPEHAFKLMNAFWPGPLTLVLKASEKMPRITTACSHTIAVRMPRHRVALSLISESAVPIAAPSANLAGRPSPTTAQHVKEDLNGRIDMILDGGPTQVGLESTVLDLTVTPAQILRPGGTTYEELSKLIEVDIHPAAIAKSSVKTEQALSPGMRHKHYAPNAEMIVVEGKLTATIRKVQNLADTYMNSGKKVGVLATDESASCYRAHVVKSLGSRNDLNIAARNLFRMLREFDEEKVETIIAESVPLEGLGLALMNRLRRASGFNIIKAE